MKFLLPRTPSLSEERVGNDELPEEDKTELSAFAFSAPGDCVVVSAKPVGNATEDKSIQTVSINATQRMN